MIRPRRLVLVGHRVPVAPETRHANAHLLATAHGRDVSARGAVHDLVAARDERSLFVGRQPLLQPDSAWCDVHVRALGGQRREKVGHKLIMIGIADV